MNERITKAELSRRLGCSKTMIGKYLKRGMPVEKDGTVCEEKAREWLKVNNLPMASGNFVHRRERTSKPASDPSIEPSTTSRTYEDGFRHGSRHVWNSLRDYLPEILAPWPYPTHWKGATLALIDVLCNEWLKEIGVGTPPPIDLSKFLIREREARSGYEATLEWLEDVENCDDEGPKAV